MRLFVAIPIAEAVREQIARLAERLQRPDDELRWSAPESWHITLQFLGAVSTARYECLRASLTEVSTTGFELRMGDFERPGIFYVAVQGTPELESLQRKVVAATAGCGFEAQERAYRPHITLARNRGRGAGISRLKARVGATPQLPAFPAREFLLYESFPGASGSRYEVRQRFSLR